MFRADTGLPSDASLGTADLKGEPIVALSEPTIFASPLSPTLDELMRSATIVSPLTGILCQFVAAGAGIAIVDPFAVAGLDNPDLVSIPIEPAIPIRIAIVTSTNRRPSTLAQEFIAATKAAFASTKSASPVQLKRLGPKRRQPLIVSDHDPHEPARSGPPDGVTPPGADLRHRPRCNLEDKWI